MNNGKLKRIILVYMVLIPVMWILTEGVWGGLHGILIGSKIGMALREPQKSTELINFMKEHGITESTSKEEAESWTKNLSQKDREQFQVILLKTISEKNLVSFGSALAVCIIVFGLIGLVSGALTKTWLFAGIFPGISFVLNNPVIRFQSILHISLNQKIIIVLVGQFLACYIFAFTGAYLCNRTKKEKQQKEGEP